MFRSIFLVLLAILFSGLEGKSDNNTVTYSQAIATFENLAENSPHARLLEYGNTDIGKPLHLFLISGSETFTPEQVKKEKKIFFLIMNAIHPGEPCGVDASIRFATELLKTPEKMDKDVVIGIIPVYNIGGALNRGCCSRANQNGPVEYGFRGNAQNLDLNRDFIKMDSENSATFAEIFHHWRPDIFLDTHTSNGADYQYTMTLISTQYEKAGPITGPYMKNVMDPEIYSGMKEKGYDMSPYVHSRGRTPESGIVAFYETPRYSTGYTTLFNTIGYVSEAHMFKPFEQRVAATKALMEILASFAAENREKILSIKKQAENFIPDEFTIDWEVDTTQFRLMKFKGFEHGTEISKITGKERLFYNRKKPFEKEIRYYNTYKPVIQVKAPRAYIIPQAWKDVIRRMEINQVKLSRLKNDTTIEVTAYYIKDYETVGSPYEGHYLHYNIRVEKTPATLHFYKGDYLVDPQQSSARYIIETLEPEAPDGFFAWNFFDAVLQQKEWFSSYVWEDKALEILENNRELKKEFENRKKNDPEFAENAFGQLLWIYRNSEYYEKGHLRYPVYRIEKNF